MEGGWTRVDTRTCAGCSDLHLSRVSQVRVSLAKDGLVKEQEKVLVRPLEVTEALERSRTPAAGGPPQAPPATDGPGSRDLRPEGAGPGRSSALAGRKSVPG